MAKKVSEEKMVELREKFMQDPTTQREIQAVESGEKSPIVIAMKHKKQAEEVYEKTRKSKMTIQQKEMSEFKEEIDKATYFASMPVDVRIEANQENVLGGIEELKNEYNDLLSSRLKDVPYKT